MLIKSLNGTQWVCTEENMDEFGMTCTVIDGEVNPDYNGENDIQIEYQDGSVAYMKYRRFMFRFEKITVPSGIKKQYNKLYLKKLEHERNIKEINTAISHLQSICDHLVIKNIDGIKICADCKYTEHM